MPLPRAAYVRASTHVGGQVASGAPKVTAGASPQEVLLATRSGKYVAPGSTSDTIDRNAHTKASRGIVCPSLSSGPSASRSGPDERWIIRPSSSDETPSSAATASRVRRSRCLAANAPSGSASRPVKRCARSSAWIASRSRRASSRTKVVKSSRP